MIGILKAPDIYIRPMSVYLHIKFLAWCGSLFGLISYIILVLYVLHMYYLYSGG